MEKRIRVAGTALALAALAASMVVGALGVSAARTAHRALNPSTCVFVCSGDGFKVYTIGVDAKNPPTKNFEYTDFFPSGVKEPTPVAVAPTLTVRIGDILHFRWSPDASLDSAHTATLAGLEETLSAAQNKYSPLKPDSDDGAGQFMANPLTFAPTQTDCGDSADNACSYQGSDLNSGFKANHNPDNKVSEFFVSLDLDTSQTTTVHFFCALHRGMVGQVRVLGSDRETPTSTETQMATDAAAQYATDTTVGLVSEAAANHSSVVTNSDGTHTVTMTAGTAGPHVEVMEMLPNNVTVKPGDKVTWVDRGFDIHTVTFPRGHGSDSVDPFKPPVCEGTGTTDTAAPNPQGPPPFGCSSIRTVESPLDLAAHGPTAIASTLTVATSGVLLSALAGAPLPDRYTFSFTSAGTFAYQCRIHDNMVGAITVAAPAPPVLPATGGAPWRSIPLLLGALVLLCGLAVLRFRPLVRK